jgi:hypothetical protein
MVRRRWCHSDAIDNPGRNSEALFEEWLAARDREVAANALRDAADRFMPHPTLGLARLADAAADLLRAEADRTEKGAGDVR